MRAFPMDAQAYVGVGAPIRADYYVVSPHNIRGAIQGPLVTALAGLFL